MSRRSRRSKRKLPETPVQLEIDRLSHEGRGIASNEGKVAFVDGALPGEKVTAKYQNSRSRYDELTVESVLEASPERVVPGCAFFGTCGGCSLQHLEPKAQINFKQQLLLEQLTHATGLDSSAIELLDILQANPYHYRRKARLAVRYVAKKGGVLVGFREKYSSFITDMDDCQVLEEAIASLIKPLRELINQLQTRQFIPQFEVALGETEQGNNQVALVMRHLQPLPEHDTELILEFAKKQRCDFYLQPKGTETIHKIWPVNEPERLQYFLPTYDLVMHFHPVDFVQVNAAINRQVIPLALELLDLQPDDKVLDLFCGLGNFTLPLARGCDSVTGVEGSAEMIARAMENAELNKVDNARFYTANLYESLENQPWSVGDYSKVLLDPPRSGAMEVLDLLDKLAVRKIVYISCNPATLARDAARLVELGFTLKRVGVMDMFPHTAHVESIAEFEKTG